MQINPYLAVMVLLALLAVSWRFTRRKRNPERDHERTRRSERKVEGFQVWSPLHVRMGRGCIFDYGMQYGPGFRRKEGPLLPHDPYCRCETVPFSFTGSEVFTGALRRVASPSSLETGFPVGAITPMMTALKRINAEPLPGDIEAYLTLVALDAFAPPDRDAVSAFLRERYRFLVNPESPSPSPMLSETGRPALDPAPKSS